MSAGIQYKKDYKDTPNGRATAEKYKDIINLQRPASHRPKMDHIQRAKIFSPYDALRGFDEAIEASDEKEKEVKRIDLSDEQKAVLSDKLLQVRKGMKITVQYFSAASGGKGNYVTSEGVVSRIDPVYRTIEIEERAADTTGGKIEKVLPTVIKFDDLKDVSSPEIKAIDEFLGIE